MGKIKYNLSKKNFILHDSFNKALSKQEFELAKESYLDLIEQNKYAIKKSDSIYELITNIKRAPEKIGPYQNISFFEALNRIGSDLVLLSGATYLFDGGLKGINPKSIHLRMGTTHGFDFEVNTKDGKLIYGEAYNAAESFCKEKMRQAIHKLIDKNGEEGIVFVNKGVKKYNRSI
jgi:hypothetical protein